MMPIPISSLLEEVSRDHFPHAPATPEEIEEFERRVGWTLDPDLRAFYLHCNGAELFKRLPNTPYRLLSLAEIIRARVAIYGEDDDKWGPASMYTLCDVQDGDYVLVDVARQENDCYPLTDGYHEAWPNPEYCEPVASSFSEFLEKALRSKGRLFYLQSTSQEEPPG
ncbi:SMI1/KNR4 family protein [Cystobacter fuscus]|nr:SMI1/KNR4 family protein [Cystobacter fuscus]